MGKTSIGPRIGVDGEEKYRQQLAQIIEQAKTLDAQMGALTSSFAKNTSQEEKAAKTGKLLAEQLQNSQKRVDLLREMVEKSAEATGENSRQTLKWKQALYGAEEEANKLRAKTAEAAETVQDMSTAMEESGGKTVHLGDAVNQVAGKLGINLPDGAKKALNGMKDLSAGSVAAMGAVAAAVAVAIKGIEKLNEITEQAATKADDLLTKSVVSGINTTRLQQFQYAAPFIDVDAETQTAALTKITRSLATAREQQEAYAQAVQKAAEQGKVYEGDLGAMAAAFQQLGVSVTDSVTNQLRDADTVMYEALEALSGIGNETERDTVAMQLFGKSAQELNPLILNLDEAQRLYNEAIAEGYVLSEDQLEILGAVDDAHQHYIQTIEKNQNLIAVQWAPTNQKAYEMLADLTNKAGKAMIDSKLVENFGSLVQSTLSLVDAGAHLVESLPGWVDPIQQVSESMKGLAIIMATVADAANVISGLLTLDFNRVGTALGWNLHKGEMSNLQQLKYSGSDYVSYNASGTEYFRGGLTWVGEQGPELVELPQGSRIYSNKESLAIAGEGGNTYNINVANVEELQQLLDLMDGLRVRRRMA